MLKNNLIHRIAGIVAVGFFLIGLFPRCANIVAPQGGPKDTLPPRVVRATPPFGTKNFTASRIFIEFDEYVKLVDLQKEFFTSPFMGKRPTISLRGRGIQIVLYDTLRTNATYSLNFGTSVRDNNEGNILHGLRYVFSTGDEIDSLLMSGYTVDGFTKDSVANAFIMFYKSWKDSIPDYDSTVFNAVPVAVGRSNPNGIFIAENLKPIDYRVYAMEDNNFNQTYEPGVDRIGFLDTVYNPTMMPPFDIWFDESRGYFLANAQIYFRMFMDEPFRRQFMAGASRPLQQLVVLKFGAPYPVVENLEFFNVDTAGIIREYLKPERDSVAYWINVPAPNIPDTVRGSITYLRHDSLNNLISFTDSLALSWRRIESRQQERERLRKEREREEAIREGREVEPEPNPFKVTVEGGTSVNPERNIIFTFDYPLSQVDTGRISLIRLGEEEQMFGVRFGFERDTMKIRQWTLSAEWMSGANYRLEIPAGTFRNIAGEENDTLRSNFSVMDPERYATIVVKLTGKTPESEYVLQLLNSSGALQNEIKHAVTGNYQFNFVEPGSVKLRIVEDINGNGRWDRGNLVERRQPERVEIYTNVAGEDMITTKMNWELELVVDASKLFAPMTMESINEQISRAEQARIARIRKKEEGEVYHTAPPEMPH